MTRRFERFVMKMFPSRKQWAGWSLPSRLTAVGAYIGVASLTLSIVFFSVSLWNQDSTLLVEAKLAAQRQRLAHRLVWRVYFDAVDLNEILQRDVPAEDSYVRLLAGLPHDRLYNEAGLGERMGTDLTFSQPNGAPVSTVIVRPIGKPFQTVQTAASICRWPSYGTFIACHWNLEPGTQLKDLEELDFFAAIYLPTPGALNVKHIVLMADDAPIALFDDFAGRSMERKSVDYSLVDLNVDPHTGELLNVR